MIDTKSGGRAFPRSSSHNPEGLAPSQDGMSLRDWFAGQAVVGILCNRDITREVIPAPIAKYAYDIADAMIEESKG